MMYAVCLGVGLMRLGMLILLMGCNGPAETDETGDTDDTDLPPVVEEIAAARDVVCIRWSDGTVECDGNGFESENYKPPRDVPYVDIDGAGDVLCGVLEGGGIDCFGAYVVNDGVGLLDPELTVPDMPGVVQVSIAWGASHICVRDVEGAAICTDQVNSVLNTSDPGPFIDIDADCGLRADGSMWCGNGSDFGELPSNVDAFAAIGYRRLCWLTGGAGDCEGDQDPPAGSYTVITGGCALDDEGRATCWAGIPSPEEVGYSVIAGGNNFACAATPGGDIDCWGSGADNPLR